MVHYFTHEYFQVSKYFNLTLCSFQHGFRELIYLNIKNPPSVSIRDFDRGYKTLVGVKIEIKLILLNNRKNEYDIRSYNQFMLQ